MGKFRIIESIFVIPAIISSYLRCVGVISSRVLWEIIWFPAAFGMIIFIVRLCSVFLNDTNKKISVLGRNSFAIYLLHQPVCTVLVSLLYNLTQLPATVICIIAFGISLLFPVCIVLVCNKIYILKKVAKTLLNI